MNRVLKVMLFLILLPAATFGLLFTLWMIGSMMVGPSQFRHNVDREMQRQQTAPQRPPRAR